MRISKLESKRLVIRPLRLTDFRTWVAAHDWEGIRTNRFDGRLPRQAELTREIFREALSKWRSLAREDKVRVWGVFDKTSAELVGRIDVSTIQRRKYAMANIGYLVFPRYRGMGYAPEALRCIIPAAFKDLKYHRIEASIDLDNRSSIQTVKKAGLYREGIKKHYWFQNGRWEDQVVYIATPELFR